MTGNEGLEREGKTASKASLIVYPSVSATTPTLDLRQSIEEGKKP